MKFIKNKFIQGCSLGAGLMIGSLSHAATLGNFEGTTVTYGGYVKLDAMLSNYDSGSLPNGSLGRDFYVPSATPIGGIEANNTVDMHARQTRINLGTSTAVNDTTLKTFIELDFQATPVGDDRVTNGYAPELRLAFITYGNWMLGQNWSTFQNTAALPDSADFIGNTDGGIFVRQAQIRYTLGNWQFAVENPETTITPFKGGTRIVADQNAVPDLVARYNLTAGDLSLSFSALARQLANNDVVKSIDTINSYSFSITGKWNIGKDDIRFGINGGDGLGRYIGLNTTNDAVIKENGELEAIGTGGAFISYRHLWSEKWRSNLIYSKQTIDNDIELTGAGATKSTESARLNLFYSPTPKLSFGGELTHATREIETGLDGNMTRLQLVAKLDF